MIGFSGIVLTGLVAAMSVRALDDAMTVILPISQADRWSDRCQHVIPAGPAIMHNGAGQGA